MKLKKCLAAVCFFGSVLYAVKETFASEGDSVSWTEAYTNVAAIITSFSFLTANEKGKAKNKEDHK